MSRPARPWFRFYVEAMGDPKIRTLTPAQRWLWVAVLGAARMSPEAGVLLVADNIPHTTATLADYAAVKERDVDAGMAEFQKRGMVDVDIFGGWSVPNFTERQYESDNSTVRTRKHRSRNGDGNVSGTDQKTETETEPLSGVASAPDPRVSELVSGYVDDYRLVSNGRDPDREWRAAAGRSVKRALKNDESSQDIAICLGVCAKEGKNPGTLANVLADYHAGRERRMR
jgi:hypothetical protein